MLRSRSNARQQRPSEPSNERGGSSSSYDYGGYPTASRSKSSPGLGVAAGDDDEYYTPRKEHGKPSRFGFGVGGGGGGGGVPQTAPSKSKSFSNLPPGGRNIGGPQQQHNVWDKKAMGKTIKGPKGGGGGNSAWAVFAVAFLLTAALGGATLHYKRAITRMEHELAVVRRRGKQHRFSHGLGEDEEDDENDAGAELKKWSQDDHVEYAKLQSQKSNVQSEISKWTGRYHGINDEVAGMNAQIKHLEGAELTNYETRIAAMQQHLSEQEGRASQYKADFVRAHRSGRSGIVPGGPGHAVMQSREIESMESLDDYEDYVQRREDALWDKIDVLVEKIGKESRREAIEWFGPGPHKIELLIEYPKYAEDLPPAEWPRTRGVFTVEMAPLDLMPIAVNLFLQQVHHKLWNGCSFVINAMHILQAGPHRYTAEGAGRGEEYTANLPELVQRFEQARLDRMPFQEYSEDYPHERYTLGFAGRPGGPDFYINKVDNTVNHGPGGQNHHDLHEEADTCFGKIVAGMEILDEINRIPVDYDRGALLLHSVEIVDSRVVSARAEEVDVQQQQPPVQQQEQVQQQVEGQGEQQQQQQQTQQRKLMEEEHQPMPQQPIPANQRRAMEAAQEAAGGGDAAAANDGGRFKKPAMGPSPMDH